MHEWLRSCLVDQLHAVLTNYRTYPLCQLSSYLHSRQTTPVKKYKHMLLVVTVLCLLVITVTQCMDANNGEGTGPRGRAYAGAEKCAGCHKNIHTSFAHSAHNNTSSIASPETVKGNFAPNANEYFYRADQKVVMEKRDSGLFQVLYENNAQQRASRFDIVMGSGRKAQTFLFWEGNSPVQLPVSWSVVANSWVNSPNYPAHKALFDRNIPVGCFECHSSYIKLESSEVMGTQMIDNFNRNEAVYGIDCERCHGPAAKHAFFHEQNPQEKKATFIATYASLTMQQKIDMCAVCHSGQHTSLISTFRFKPGDTLLNKYYEYTPRADVAKVDVHGNQTQLLQASPCFIKSKMLTCTSCHDTHVTERNNMAVFSQRCMSCHTTASHNFCTMADAIGAGIVNNCIDCHMPATPSKLVTLLSNGRDSATPNMVRTHFISLYPEATKKFMHP